MYSIHNQESHISVRFSGDVNDTSLLQAVHDVASLPEYAFKNDVWIFTDCPAFVSYSKFGPVIMNIENMYLANASRTKTAIVTTTGYNTALASIFAREAASLPYEIRVFSDIDSAEAWIRAE
jgi:hypothetical protein